VGATVARFGRLVGSGIVVVQYLLSVQGKLDTQGLGRLTA
jgi:hypothetical protein